jgi:hypothetical protein
MGKERLFTDSMWPPTLEQVKAYFLGKGQNEKEAEHFFQLYQLRHWRTVKGGMVRRWKNAAHAWICSATLNAT